MFEMRPYRRNSMSTWNPFSEMEEMERRLFNNDFFSGRGLAEFKTDITDEGDYYELKADLPGFKKEDIQLQLDGDTLTIQAQRHSEHEEQEKKGKYVCCERSYGAYSRSFDVSGIRAEGITASYDSGVLTLKLPKRGMQKIVNQTLRRLASILVLGKGLRVAVIVSGNAADITKLSASGERFTMEMTGKTTLLLGGSAQAHMFARTDLAYSAASQDAGAGMGYLVQDGHAVKLKAVQK